MGYDSSIQRGTRLLSALLFTFSLGCYEPPNFDPPGKGDGEILNSSLAGQIQIDNFTPSSARASPARALYKKMKTKEEGVVSNIRPQPRKKISGSAIKKGELVFFFERGHWTSDDLQSVVRKKLSLRNEKTSVEIPHCTAGRFCLAKFFDGQGDRIDHEATIALKNYLDKVFHGVFRHITFNDIMKPLLTANDTFYPYQWNLTSAHLQTAWDITTGSDDVVVAVVDSGIILEHPDIIGRLATGVDLIEDVGTAGDGNGRDTDPTDVGDNMFGNGQHSYHGSHVAGILGAASNNNLGMTGVMWSGKILPVRVLGYGGGSQFDILSGIYWALGDIEVSGVPENTTPARIINLSLGGEVDSETQQAWQAEVAYIFSQETQYGKPIIVVAAGNEDRDVINVTPANIETLITVGAYKFDGERASYANWGDQIDIMAPGGLTSVDQNGDGQPDGIYSFYGTDYRWEHGTSMAAPHISGILGLALSLNPNFNQEQAQQLLYDSAEQAGQCNEGCGAGLVNAGNLVLSVSGGYVPEATPRLALDSDRIIFYQDQSSAQVNIFNLGGGTLSYTASIQGTDASVFGVSPASGVLQASAADVLLVSINRGDLTEGVAELLVQGGGENSDQSFTIPISFRDIEPVENGLQSATVEAFRVLDNGQFDTGGVVAYARRSGGFEWQLDGLSAGDYYVFAVGDDNNDGVYDSEYESFGAYPNTATPMPVTVGVDQLVYGVNFALSFSTDTLVEGIGAPCQVNSDCSFFADGECITAWPGGYCSRFCDDGNCGFGGICVVAECDTGPCSICLAGCDNDSDCRRNVGYQCDDYNTCTPSGF